MWRIPDKWIGPIAMQGEPLTANLTVTSPQGFHLRPLSAFAQAAGGFSSSVFLVNEAGKRFDAKSPFSLLGMCAEQGARLTLEVSGQDQESALKELLALWPRLSSFSEETPEVTGGENI